MNHRPRAPGRWAYAPAWLIAFGGAALLVAQWYRTRPMWVDEEMIALNLRDRDFAGLTGSLWMNQAAPLGWLWLQRIILTEMGTAERTLRALPVLFGICTLALAWWAGRRWLDPVSTAALVLLCSLGQFIGYFPLEVKHYSADVFFGLLLPVLGAWALEPATVADSLNLRRMTAWWIVAAAAQWCSNGALFAAPGCAVVLCLVAWRRAGWQRASVVAAIGVVWLASFALHYRLSIRQAVSSEYLQSYWAEWLPPSSGGGGSVLRWLGAQFEPLSVNPGGTHLWIAFWLTALYGLARIAMQNPTLGLMLLSLPPSAFLLAGLRLVPLSGRLFLWALPALYAGIAFAAGEGAASAQRWWSERKRTPAVAVAIVALLAGWVVADVAWNGGYELSIQPQSKHNFDDRAAVRYLLTLHEPGDAVISTHMGLPAVWWYANVNVGSSLLGGTYGPDGSPVLEARHHSPGPDCDGRARNALAGQRRVVVYLGFDSRTPDGFQELTLDALSELGAMVVYRRVAEDGIVAVFDLTKPPRPWAVVVTRPGGTLLKEVVRPAGCVGFYPARRW